MRALALTLETIARRTSTESKVQAGAAYLAGHDASTVSVAARFLAGSPLPPGTPATKVGRSTLVDIVAAFTGTERSTLLRRAQALGDMGTAVAEIIDSAPGGAAPPLDVRTVSRALLTLGTHGRTRRARILQDLFARANALEAKYLTKLLLGSLRTGMQAARVEESIALAFDHPLADVRRAHMLLGDIGETARRAAGDRLHGISLRAFRPVRVMLAHPADSAEAAVAQLPDSLIAENKYDGIRAQWHLGGGKVHVYSRAREDVSHFFPEIRAAPPGMRGEWILDGEVVAWHDGRALAFGELQRRLGRREVPLTMLLDAPVVFLAFDVLRADGEDLVDAPLVVRKRALEVLPVRAPVRRASWSQVSGADAIQGCFDAAVAAGNEGVVLKDPESRYQPGTRGRAWVKFKRPLGTLDVVVTGAEWGRGKRAGMLSDLIFAVRTGDDLVDAGRAYSGLTDTEIVQLTAHFKSTTVRSAGPVRRVTPEVVLEVAFDDVRRSSRHPAGYALRFPRIVRRRVDLSIDEISSVDDLRDLCERGRGPTVAAS